MHFLSAADTTALLITLQLACLSTFVLLLLGLPLACWLAFTQWRFKFVVEAAVALPLVLPPTVLGFYLLLLLGPNGWLGQASIYFSGQSLAFTFEGLLIGSVLYSLPFVVQPLQSGLIQLGRQPFEVASILGCTPWQALWRVGLPLLTPSLLTAGVLAFAHTLGEFGVVLMIGGSIPGETQLVSIAIYDHVETLQYHQANNLSLLLLLSSFVLLMLLYVKQRPRLWFATPHC